MDPTANTHRLRCSPDVRIRLESAPCHACEDLCWTVTVYAHDLVGSGEKACLLYRDHMPMMGAAITFLGRWMMTEGRRVAHQDAREYALDHWPSLF